MSEEQLYETYEQKVNLVKEMSSYYFSNEEIDAEICNTEEMKNIMDQKLDITSDLVKGIFGSNFVKTKVEDKEVKCIFNDFYNKHPFLTPFVGKHYSEQNKKFLLVLESHYLPSLSRFYEKLYETDEDKNKWLKEQWYDFDFSWEKLQSSSKSEISLYREDIEYIWTESVVKNNIKNNKRFRALFGKILKPIFNIENEQIEDTIQSTAFMNYFLRPSEYTGASIKHEYIDSLFSYLNLIRVWKALDEPNIIICSAKARKSFEFYWGLHKNYGKTYLIPENKFCLCNHPSNRSWDKSMENNETSEERLLKFIKNVYQ